VIDFRYHVVSLVAVFLALALGLFIGSTTLRPKVAQDLKNRTDRLKAINDQLNDEKNAAADSLKKALDFEKAMLPYAVADQLSAQTVVIVSLPDAESSQRDDVRAALEAAGATVTGDVRLQDSLFDPTQDAFLTALTDRVALPGHALPETSGVDRSLALLADVLGRRPQRPVASAAAAARVVTAFSTGDLLSVSGDPPRPASLAVVVAGPASEGSATPSPGGTTDETLDHLAAFARYLDEAAVGTVVAGPSAAAAGGGLLNLIRAEKSLRSNVSTVDGLENPRGAVATVLALAEQREGGAGSYGDDETPLPSRSPS
jgi:hypothetical protein